MKNLTIRYAVFIGLLLGFLGVTYAFEHRSTEQSGTVDIFALPSTVGHWQATEVPVDDNIKNVLETQSVLMRDYSDGINTVLLTIVYYNDSRVALHLPESCYTGQGSEVVGKGKENMGDFTANKFLLEGNKGNKLVLYYFETGSVRTDSYAAMRLAMLKSRLTGNDHGCALVRLSIIRSGDTTEELSKIKRFAKEIAPVLPKYLL
jgi:EpsI family protein